MLTTWLAPVLFPSWRFFDRVGTGLVLEFAWVTPAAADITDWREFSEVPERYSWTRALLKLFVNPRGNDRLYVYAQCEKILTEESAKALEEVRARIARSYPPTQGDRVLILRLRDRLSGELLFLSAPTPLPDMDRSR